MSWSREILPVPMAPIFRRLLGAFFPSTLAGTMVGKPMVATPVATPAFTVPERNDLRLMLDICNRFEWFYLD
jgi:hypothetical protein